LDSQQLEEKGLLEDMSVYQDMGSDDSLASESPANEFGQLEGVVGKVWCKLQVLDALRNAPAQSFLPSI